MKKILLELRSTQDKLIKIVMSDMINNGEFTKTTLQQISLKGELYWHAESIKNNQAHHANIEDCNIEDWLVAEFNHFRQINLVCNGLNISYFLKQNGNYRRLQSINKLAKPVSKTHNNVKNYILAEGENIPALIDLGIFNSEYKIIKSKYDKYKQINRFIEIVDDMFKESDRKNITILDFGSGKSYLTFIMYYYFTVKKGMNAKIIGYDIKSDVVADCNAVAEKYGYDNLKFIVSDVSKDNLYNEKIDMVVSLHACNTATDHALANAISRGVPYILSVPCCQHEINTTINKGGDLDIMLRHGLIKERMSALLTDSVRAEVLEQYGYNVDMLEFVDFSHSPKNIMIRAKLASKGNKNLNNIKELMSRYNFEQTLVNLLDTEK